MLAYQNMKNSEVAWLGSVPSEWSVVRPKVIFRDRREKSSSDDIHLTPSQKYGVLPQQDYMKISGSRVVLNLTGSDNMKHVESGDFVIHLRSFQGGIEYSPHSGKVSNAYTILQPYKQIHHGYYKYVLKSYGFISDLASTTDQLRDGQSIKFSTFNLVKLPLPGIETQERIADYLDEEIKKIDTLMLKQEHLLKLIEEKRKAEIIRLTTKGTDSSVETKNSDIRGIGIIPSHWEIARSNILFSENKDSNKDLISSEAMKFKFGEIVFKELPADFNYNELRHYKLVRENDIMVNGLNLNYDFVTQRVALVKSEGCITPAYIALRPRPIIRSEYAALLLKSLDSQKVLNGWGSGIRLTLNFSEFKKTYLCLPPIQEQDEIIAECELISKKYDTLSSCIRKQVSLLKERRVSLISNVVTGKVKV